MTAETAKQPRVVLCLCAYYDIIPRSCREQVLAGLQEKGVAPEVVSDLCGLAANRDPRLKTWVDEGPLTIVACFPRAVRWLLHATGVALDGQVRLFNMRTQSPEEIVRGLMKDDGLLMIEKESAPSANYQSSISNHQSDWVPWFPVIDYSRCKSCKQCLNFCLFGVYALSDEGRVEVRKPAGCKTNCPACARMCPSKAIIFPKYADAHINGDDIPAEIADLNGGDNPQSAITNPQSGDILERIRRHGEGHKRFAKQADGQPPVRSCPTLESLRRELGIPDDVLTSLSPAEVQRITAKSQGDSRQSSGQPSDGDRKDGDHDE
jgi:NAD-dependent dihydropyrimidine dehydrogenase PreA subunit